MLLPVYLNADEMLVHEGSGFLILKALPLHDVAPVTSRIAYRDDYRLILGLCPKKGLIPPGVPINGIMGMLQEIWALLVDQAIRHR
jgi:hypothetical protein